MMTAQAEQWLTVSVRGLPLALPLTQIQEVVLWIPWQKGPPGTAGLVGFSRSAANHGLCGIWRDTGAGTHVIPVWKLVMY